MGLGLTEPVFEHHLPLLNAMDGDTDRVWGSMSRAKDWKPAGKGVQGVGKYSLNTLDSGD